MRLRFSLICTCLLVCSFLFAQENTTPTYGELITSYQNMAAEYPQSAKLLEYGNTDSGKPLHLFVIDHTGKFDPVESRKSKQAVVLIMNGIHPGEACGINASLIFAEQKIQEVQNNVVYAIIPVYNIGGALRRNSKTRANQVGPEEHGFRGNSRNLDLNRDFIKADSQNTLSFYEIFHEWQPHIFVDTHTSNGADYQHKLTLISSFPEKLETAQATFLRMELEPTLYREMAALQDPMIPYVNSVGENPFEGINAFNDRPRYSIGYTALYNILSFTTEAHMLKSFAERVGSTLNFLEILGNFTEKRAEIIVNLKENADNQSRIRQSVGHNWAVNEEAEMIVFSGFAIDTTYKSQVTGLPLIKYDRDKPITAEIPYFRNFEAKASSNIPSYYVVPQAYADIIEKLKASAVKMERFTKDTTISVLAKYIENFETYDRPYEGHYVHYNTQTTASRQKVQFYKGDYLIPTNQVGSKYLATVFDPENADSFFSYNFFDSSLDQKEYFSSYLFDETAVEILSKNPQLKKAFMEKREADEDFAKNTRESLDFIYKNSEYFEQTSGRIPVFEIER